MATKKQRVIEQAGFYLAEGLRPARVEKYLRDEEGLTPPEAAEAVRRGREWVDTEELAEDQREEQQSADLEAAGHALRLHDRGVLEGAGAAPVDLGTGGVTRAPTTWEEGADAYARGDIEWKEFKPLDDQHKRDRGEHVPGDEQVPGPGHWSQSSGYGSQLSLHACERADGRYECGGRTLGTASPCGRCIGGSHIRMAGGFLVCLACGNGAGTLPRSALEAGMTKKPSSPTLDDFFEGGAAEPCA